MWTLVLLIISFLPIVVHQFFKRKFTYWEKRHVPALQPTIPHGNYKGIGKTKHLHELLDEVYFTFKGQSPVAGMYFFFSPIAIPTDLDLIKNILIKDFSSFHDRWFYYNEKIDPLSANMFALYGDKWKAIRAKLTPTFTSGKMKFMFPTVVDISSRLVKTMTTELKLGSEMEVKDILARFTTDVIGECAFGIECNTLDNSSAEFREYGRIALGAPRHSRIVVHALKQFPDIAAKLRMKITRDDVTEFFIRIVRETVEYREKHNIRRNDFMDLLIELKNTSNEKGEENLTLEEITAQVFLFFIAGFETSSTTLSFALYELALDQRVQTKAREEIHSVLMKYDGVLAYEAIMEMQYVDSILSEILRKYPPMHTITRQTTHEYQIPDTDIALKKGTTIFIPVYSIHHDPTIYPDPEAFNPDRFSPEEVKQRHPMSYLAFGEGPRNCIGMRFGRMETKIALVDLLRNFKFTTSARTRELVFDKKVSLLATQGGIYLNVEKLEAS